jgi:hypothetical protein
MTPKLDSHPTTTRPAHSPQPQPRQTTYRSTRKASSKPFARGPCRSRVVRLKLPARWLPRGGHLRPRIPVRLKVHPRRPRRLIRPSPSGWR